MSFLAPEMLPYSVSFLIFAIFAFLEIVSFVLGWGIFSFLDDIFDVEHSDMDVNTSTSLGDFFSYVNPQKVPFSMVLLSFFFIFGLTGHLLQNIFGLYPLYVTLPIVIVLTIILLRHTTNLIAKIMPRETSEVVSTDSFIGKKATILDPIAKRDMPARAKLHDVYGEVHYIRVEPFDEKDEFLEGMEVIVLEKRGGIFLVEKAIINA
jgi:hypothetical protein